MHCVNCSHVLVNVIMTNVTLKITITHLPTSMRQGKDSKNIASYRCHAKLNNIVALETRLNYSVIHVYMYASCTAVHEYIHTSLPYRTGRVQVRVSGCIDSIGHVWTF